MPNETNGFSAWLIRIFDDLCGTEASAMLATTRRSVQERTGRAAGNPLTLAGVAMTFERPAGFEAPLAKVLATLGGGLITGHARGSNQAMSINPPRK